MNAGLLIAAVGPEWSYALNAVCFIAVMSALLAMGAATTRRRDNNRTWTMLAGGLQFAWSHPLVVWPMLLDLTTRVVGSAGGLLPIFAKAVFAVGPQGLGALNSAFSLGAVLGGPLLGAQKMPASPVAIIVIAYSAEAATLLALGLAPTFPVALAVLLTMGVANVAAEVPLATLVQLSTPDELRCCICSQAADRYPVRWKPEQLRRCLVPLMQWSSVESFPWRLFSASPSHCVAA